MQTGFAVNAFVCLILNLIIPEEVEVEDVQETPAKEIQDTASSTNGNGYGTSKPELEDKEKIEKGA